jgi:hypothetical protein
MTTSDQMTEYETEPVRGLPAPLPAGETLLWQGGPAWWPLARSAFHFDKIAIYFGLMIAWRIATSLSEGATYPNAGLSALPLLALALCALAILLVLAWASARASVYTITSKRVVLRIGIAFPMALNIPYRLIGNAALKVRSDGSGDIPLALTPGNRIAWMLLWPHVRPRRMLKPEPTLRAIPDAAKVAAILAPALTAANGANAVTTPIRQPAKRRETAGAAGLTEVRT